MCNIMAEHHELVAEMLVLEQMGTQERQKLAKKRRLQQLKKWSQREKEWIAKERQLDKRLASKLQEENNGLNLKQYTTYGSNPRPKRLPANTNTQNNSNNINGTETNANGIISTNLTSNSSKNLIKNRNNNLNNNNNSNYNNNNNNSSSKAYTNNGIKSKGPTTNGYGKESSSLTPNGRVHFNVGVMLLEAAARNDLDEVKRLLMLGVSPDSVNHDGLTALHQCCIDASEPIMNLLLEFGASVDARDTEQWTPLHAACTCGHLNLVKILVENGADLLAVNGDGNMPFDICEDEATLDYIESQMVKRGVTQEMIDITRASTEVQMISDLEKLVAEGGDLDQPLNDDGVTALHIAAANGYLSVVKFLLKHGVNVNVCDKDLWRPLHGVACWGNEQHSKVVELLVDSGAQLTAKTTNDETVFDLCDNVNLLEKLNQLKDELESKQATNTDNTLRRTQSRTNSRVHSVRRTSVRDKNQISRREAREEALLRVESETSVPTANGTSAQPTTATTTTTNIPQNGLTKSETSSRQSGSDSTYPETKDTVDFASSKAIETDLDAQTPEDEVFHDTRSSFTSQKKLEHNSTSKLEPDQNVQRSMINGKTSDPNLKHYTHFDESICKDPTCDSSSAIQPQQQPLVASQSAVQLIPINYTLSNLKKHRSDLRMRTTTIGGGGSSSQSIITVNGNISNKSSNNQQLYNQIQLDPQASSTSSCGVTSVEVTSKDHNRSESPSSTFRKFHGEPSEVLGAQKRSSGAKCCVIM